jgi:hypothetical protein
VTFDLGPNALAAILALVSLGCSVVALLRARENAQQIQVGSIRTDAISVLANKAVDVMHSHDGKVS